VNPSPDELLAQANELFDARRVARMTTSATGFFEEMPCGHGHVLALDNSRPGWWRLRVFAVDPNGRRIALAGAGVRLRAEALPALAGMISRALAAQLAELPSWATSAPARATGEVPAGERP
jgi:hypothetical protein